MAELLFWPALLAYGEAPLPTSARRRAGAGPAAGWRPGACGSAGSRRRALLVVQAARADGFPWATWAGSLNLFVWLVVAAYLIWGCRARYRLLGLAVMPLAAVLFASRGSAAARAIGTRSHYSNVFLVLHVGLVLAAFAGFTLAAGLSASLPLAGAAAEAARRRHPAPAGAGAADARRPRRPDDRGLAAGADARAWSSGSSASNKRAAAARRADGGDARDLARSTARTSRSATAYGWRGRRAAYLALAGFALVIVVRLALPATHFA